LAQPASAGTVTDADVKSVTSVYQQVLAFEKTSLDATISTQDLDCFAPVNIFAATISGDLRTVLDDMTLANLASSPVDELIAMHFADDAISALALDVRKPSLLARNQLCERTPSYTQAEDVMRNIHRAVTEVIVPIQIRLRTKFSH
jgi:hypothetical protein